MTLGELLTELRENILHDRSDRTAGTPDYLWSDETLVRYIDQAQKRFARDGLVLRDASTSDVCQITLQQGVDRYALHPTVLGVISARFEGDTSDLTRSGHSAFAGYKPPDTYAFDFSNVPLSQYGKPLAYGTDEGFVGDDYDSLSVITFRVYPLPDAAQANKKIYLRVVRLPLEGLTVNNLNATPEIPEDYHLDMLDWAAYLALRIVDQDAGWSSRANEFRASFEAHVKNAKSDAMRKLFAASTWGFGRNGFSWES